MLVTHIGQLVTNDSMLGPTPLGIITDAAIVVEHGRVAWVGKSSQVPEQVDGTHIDAKGRTVVPGFVDSHAHPVFAGDRAAEFAARMEGKPYAAGGIRTTVTATRAASDAELSTLAGALFAEALAQGTTTMEAKSGYGLTVSDEVRSLKIAGRYTEEVTFLGAHVVPPEYKEDPDSYVDLVVNQMIPACQMRAKWIDVFCDRGAFDEPQTRRILTAGVKAGLQPRLHTNQLQHGPGLQLAVEFDAASADHATYATDTDIDALAHSNTVVTLLPGAEFSTRSPYPNARRFLDAGVRVAIAADCNPGTSYTTSMPFCLALAVRDMHMSPDEALLAATLGGAQALRRKDIGHLGVGARADMIFLDTPSHLHLAYRPGVPLISQVMQRGRIIKKGQ
ncbi:MAG: imidazolonepropionase [Propionibacteriaceae bacterium]